MAEAFFNLLIGNLSSLIQKEIGLIMGVDKEMKKLQSTLTTIQSVLEDAEAKQLQNMAIQNWLSKLNHTAFEIDDVLDECATELSKLEHRGSKFNLKKILFRLKMGRRVKEMAERLDDLAAERRNFHLCKIVVAPRSTGVDCTRETGSILIEPDHVYGRDEDKEKLVDVLVNHASDREHLSVLPIIGVGGLGKTTLAQLVFNDQRVCKHFGTKIWVCVSDNFDLKVLLEAMIVSVTGSASNLVQLDALQRRLWEVLHETRYLLILDDVWNDNQEKWVKLRSILVCGSKGASVVVTTRRRKVADIMGTLPAHSLKGLSEENLWWLFKLRSFGQEGEVPPNLETIGRQMVKKCAGVPLAAKALGGLLRFKREEKEWIHVRESDTWDISEEESVILPALRLSYHHLPLELRRCFAYCAVFPKHTEMEKQDLIFHWIAHGCISSNGVHEVEDIGDKIWNELVLRSLLEEVSSAQGLETAVKMHDLVHDLAQSILENRVPRAEMKSSLVNVTDSKIREAYFSKYYWDSCSTISLKVSTFTCITKYTRLRILKLNWAREEKLPNGIGKLKHLRYLDMTNSGIHSLPHTFCKLWNLQILILSDCIHLEILPKNIRHMINLRHIFLDGCSKLNDMPSRIGELTSLKTLSLFIVGDTDDKQLNQLQLLNLGGRLEIQHLERIKNHVEAKNANLRDKPNLRFLILSWGGEESRETMDEKVLEALEPHPLLETLEINGFKGSCFPHWMENMKNLTHVTLKHCPNCLHLPLIGDLPHLKSLYLWSIDRLEYIVDQNKIFPSLERLRVACLPNLKGVAKEEDEEERVTVFPNLRELYIRDCEVLSNLEHHHLLSLQSLRLWMLPQLSSLPEWLGDSTSLAELVIRQCPQLTSLPSSTMPNLSSLAIFDCPQLQTRCQREDGHDWHKIAHIPHLLIR